MATEIDLTAAGSQTTIDGAIFLDSANIGSGTGNYNTFLALSPTPSQSGNEQGFNSDDTPPINSTNQDIDQSKTHTVLLSSVPIIVVNGIEYYEFRVDLNEANSNPNGQISLDQFKIYSSTSGTIESTTTLFTQNLVYSMDGSPTGDVSLKLSEVSTGSGTDDYAVLVPVSKFAGLDPATTYMYLYVDMGSLGGDYVAAGGFEEWNLQSAGTLTGTKFSDVDSDGIRDAGEPGVAGVTIFIDANKNGVLDAGERSTVTDANGNYTFYGVPLGTWQIDEVTPAGETQTTGNFETATITTVGQVVTVDPIGNHIPQPALNVTKTVTDVDGDTVTKVVDKAGDVVHYTIAVENTGEVALTGITVTDKVEAGGTTNATFVGGDTNSNGKLDVGETWTYTASYTATQDDIDSNGVTGDGDIDNLATADSDQTGPDTATASVPIVLKPALNVTKTVADVDGDTVTKVVDKAGDVVHYTITVENTGNVALTGITVTDKVEAGGTTSATFVGGDTDLDGKLDVGETWTYTASYTATQDDIDSNGVTGDGDIDNLATADSNETDPDTATASVPIDLKPALNVTKTVADVDGDTVTKVVDKAGDVVHYTITVENTGNVALTGITVTDKVEAGGTTSATFVGGDTDLDGKLDVGETWTYTASYTATQDDIDSNGVTGDGDIDNLATADSNETDPDTATASVPIDLKPALNVTKTVADVDGDTVTKVVDKAGDVVHYTITVENTGNVALTGITVTDKVEAGGTTSATFVGGDTDLDGKLDVGETWTYTASYVATQDDIDSNGVTGDGDIDNLATADSNETDPDTATASVPIVLKPDLTITKAAVVEDGHADHAGDLIDYTVVVTNTGNVVLTGVVVTDVFEGGAPLDLTNFNSATNTFSGDTDGDGNLDVGETWTYTYKHTLTQGELDSQGVDGDGSLDNVASVTTNETGPDSDDAHIPVELGPGVRTPGFWAQSTGGNQWTKFWDGIVGNEPKQAGTNGFANGEITYAVDSNHDGVINSSDKTGLLIGDYDKDGIQDPGENVLFISTADALTLLNASAKQVQDGRYMLGRDLVATWLNYLEGNAIGDGTAGTAKYDINQSVYWFEATQAKPGVSTTSADFHTLSVKDDLSSGAVGTSSPLWTSPIDVVVLGQPIHTDLAASTLHSQLDHYNNFGSV